LCTLGQATLALQVQSTVVILHKNSDTGVWYAVYHLPLRETAPRPLCGYYELHGPTWVDRLSWLPSGVDPAWHMDTHKGRVFLACSDHPQHHRTVRIELTPADTSELLAVQAMEQPEAILSTTTNVLLQWLQPCLEPACAYAGLSVMTPSVWECTAYTAEGRLQTQVQRHHAPVQGQCTPGFFVNFRWLVPFLTGRGTPCELRWSVGRPLEWHSPPWTVYLAPFEFSEEIQPPAPPPLPRPPTKGKRKSSAAVPPPPVLNAT